MVTIHFFHGWLIRAHFMAISLEISLRTLNHVKPLDGNHGLAIFSLYFWRNQNPYGSKLSIPPTQKIFCGSLGSSMSRRTQILGNPTKRSCRFTGEILWERRGSTIQVHSKAATAVFPTPKPLMMPVNRHGQSLLSDLAEVWCGVPFRAQVFEKWTNLLIDFHIFP